MEQLTKFFGLVFIGTLTSLFRAFVLLDIYNWFFKASFKTNFSVVQMYAVLLALSMIFYSYKSEKNTDEDMFLRLVSGVAITTIVWGFAYLASLFM